MSGRVAAAPVGELLDARRRSIEDALERALPAEDQWPASLHAAMRYSLFAGGKRLRPILALAATRACGGSPDAVLPAACALEMIHTYSLIHDDLPAMDDDDLRRGQPTCHKQFGEGLAILTGDALLTFAFETLAHPRGGDQLAAQLVRELAQAVGTRGMVGGQVADLDNEGRTATAEVVESIHRQKTARLMEASCRMGGLIGRGTAESVEALAAFGSDLGQAFQIADDLLDVGTEGMAAATEDPQRGSKQTLPHSVGIEKSRRIARQTIARAVDHLARFGEDAADLRSLADFVVDRNY